MVWQENVTYNPTTSFSPKSLFLTSHYTVLMGVTGVICHHVNSGNSQKKSFMFFCFVETWWDYVNPTMREILGLQFVMVTYQMICYKTHVSLERNWRMFFFLKVSGNLKSMHDSCKSNIPVQCLSRVEKMSKTFTKARLCIRKKSWWREISHIIGKIYFTTESNSHRLIKHGLQIN